MQKGQQNANLQLLIRQLFDFGDAMRNQNRVVGNSLK